MGISLDCHGQSPRNDAEIATSRADSRNDVAGILLPTRIVVGAVRSVRWEARGVGVRVLKIIPVWGGTRGVRVWVCVGHSEQSEESGNQYNSVSVDSFRSFDCATLRSG